MARTKDKLTVKGIQAAKYPCPKLFDGGGLFLLVTETGKYWRLKYRFAGKEKLMALGVYPEASLKAARAGRDEARHQLNEGIDPSAHRRATRTAITQKKGTTLEDIAKEWWGEVHQHNVVEAHAGRNLRRLQLHVFPNLGRRPIGEVTPQELLEVLRAVERKGHGETAHRVRTLCSQIYRYAVQTGRADRDIAADLRDALRAVEDKHLAAIVDPNDIGPLLRAIAGYSGQPTTRAALSLAPLLFVRPGELRHAEWKDF